VRRLSPRALAAADAASARERAGRRAAGKRACLCVDGSSRMCTYRRGASARLSWLARTLTSRASFVRRPVLARSRRPSSTSTLARDVHALLAARVHARRCVRRIPSPAASLARGPIRTRHAHTLRRPHPHPLWSLVHALLRSLSWRRAQRVHGHSAGVARGVRVVWRARQHALIRLPRLGARDDVRGLAPAKTAAWRLRRADRRDASVCLS
jgi:hypothetical protein